MPYAHSHFQPIAELPSEYGLTIWGYATSRAPGSVDAPGFFQAFQHHLKVGDLVLVRHTGELSGPDVAERPAAGKRRSTRTPVAGRAPAAG